MSLVFSRRYFGDIVRTWYVITITGIVLATGVSLFYLLLMKYLTAFMVRGLLLCVLNVLFKFVVVLCVPGTVLWFARNGLFAVLARDDGPCSHFSSRSY